MHGPLLFIAMAGIHQIWMLDSMRGLIWPYAGSGRRSARRRHGRRCGVRAAVGADPSRGGTMFVADSESNIIRAIELPPVNHVSTLAGGDLFDFGDKDGEGDAVRFQHPLGRRASRRLGLHRRHLQPPHQAIRPPNAPRVDVRGHWPPRSSGWKRREGAVLRAWRPERGRDRSLHRGRPTITQSACQPSNRRRQDARVPCLKRFWRSSRKQPLSSWIGGEGQGEKVDLLARALIRCYRAALALVVERRRRARAAVPAAPSATASAASTPRDSPPGMRTAR